VRMAVLRRTPRTRIRRGRTARRSLPARR
jgi:hypothetical protein